jgi:hypothetical protein
MSSGKSHCHCSLAVHQTQVCLTHKSILMNSINKIRTRRTDRSAGTVPLLQSNRPTSLNIVADLGAITLWQIELSNLIHRLYVARLIRFQMRRKIFQKEWQIISWSIFNQERGPLHRCAQSCRSAGSYSSDIMVIILHFSKSFLKLYRNKVGINFKRSVKSINFNCCPSVHVDNHTIITPTKCTILLLKAPDITICTFLSYILPPTCFNPRGSSSGGSMPVPG